MFDPPSGIEAFDFSPLTDEDRKRIARQMTHTVSGAFVTVAQGGSLLWRNPRELHALSLFELDLRVEQIEVVPERVTVMVDGRSVDHIPAFRLRCAAARVVLDVVTDAQREKLGHQAVAGALTRAYASRGMRYTELRYAHVRGQPRLRNARLVLRGRCYDPPPETEFAILSLLSTPGRHTIRSISTAVPPNPHVRDAVYALATRRRIAIDLWARDPDDMVIRLASWGDSR
jgi:hypothetical protein